jgi:hypothetical protein
LGVFILLFIGEKNMKKVEEKNIIFCTYLYAKDMRFRARLAHKQAYMRRRRGGALSPLGDGGGDDVRELARIETRELERSSAVMMVDKSMSVPCGLSDE